MTETLVTIGRYSTPYEANMVMSQLESAGLPAFIADEYTIGMNWLYSNALGGVKVQVPESLASEAQQMKLSPLQHVNQTQKPAQNAGARRLKIFSTSGARFLPGRYWDCLCSRRRKRNDATTAAIIGGRYISPRRHKSLQISFLSDFLP
jgi:hypothetical protein